MKIIEKVRIVMEENRGDDKKAMANAIKATEAIQGGIDSPAWKEYMQQYAANTTQLMRLLGTDGTLDNQALSIKRAYLVANAVCAPGSTDQLDRQVDTIDE